tara:strand:- start:51 stop:305 length:255 start_codon:yes stop_codon:yes gene_type:complete
MRIIIIASLLSLLSACSGYVKVNGTERHGNVPEENPVVLKGERGIEHNATNFWFYYIPALILVGFVTYKTFHTPKKVIESKTSE